MLASNSFRATLERFSFGRLSMPALLWARIFQLDRTLMVVILVLTALGIVMISSSSMEVAEANFGTPFYHLLRHLMYLMLASTGAIFVFCVPTEIWEKSGWLCLLAALFMLLLVLIPGIGHEVNGSMRWIRLGFMGLQPSEIAKIFAIIYLASYLTRRLKEVRSQWSGFAKPLLVLALMIVLLLMEPDFGAVVVLMSATLGMMFLGGVRVGQFAVLILVSLAAVAAMAVSQPYRMQRLITYLDPWAEENVYGSGYQLTQALIAFGRGEWTGVGLGNSVQKLFYLPEAHTDFVFAILGEELGLIGVLLAIVLFALLVVRCMVIGRCAEKKAHFFPAYVCYGVGVMFAAQIIINIGVNLGLLPTKGLTLPLLSYGGTSIIACFFALALVLRVDYENRLSESNAVPAVKGKHSKRGSGRDR